MTAQPDKHRFTKRWVGEPCRRAPGARFRLRPAWVLPAILLLAACALPRNTALRDWAETASLAAEDGATRKDGPRAMQQALSIYLYALGIRASQGDLTFRPAAFAPLAARAAATDAPGGQAIAELGALLAANDGPQPYFEVSRLAALLRGADAPVQVLVARLDQATTARPQYAEVLRRIGEGHAMIAAAAGVITQRETERRIMVAEVRLQRAVALLPPAPAATPATLSAVLAP